MSNVDTSNKSKEKKKRRRNKVDGNENALKYWEQRLLKWGLEQVRLSNKSPNLTTNENCVIVLNFSTIIEKNYLKCVNMIVLLSFKWLLDEIKIFNVSE